jgi:hypothetical protein
MVEIESLLLKHNLCKCNTTDISLKHGIDAAPIDVRKMVDNILHNPNGSTIDTHL